MQFIEAEECLDKPDSAQDVYARLNRIMAGDWRASMPQIAGLMIELRREQRALRRLVDGHVRAGIWPMLQGAQSFALAQTDSMTVRCNLWFPQSARTADLNSYRKYLSIGELHNHDFFFFTICLLGPGYTTRFYLDEDYSHERQVGETPKLRDLGLHGLNGEKVLFVERDLDFHLQHWPEGFSVTLNVVPRNVSAKLPVQYILRADDLSIKTVVSTDLL